MLAYIQNRIQELQKRTLVHELYADLLNLRIVETMGYGRFTSKRYEMLLRRINVLIHKYKDRVAEVDRLC